MTTYSDALRELAEPRPVGDTVGAAIRRACRTAGLPASRTFNIWYGRARRIDAHEAERINAALELKREAVAQNEIKYLRTRLLQIESRLAAESANRSRPVLSGIRPRLR
jgi:hypothetical protein